MSIKRKMMRAFTLLEVLLTLAMSVVLMGLIGTAFQFYAVDMNVRNMDIQQTQLAAAVMQMIEDDLRATLHSEPADMSGLEELLSSSLGGAEEGGQGGSSSESEEDLSAAGISMEEEEPIEAIETTALDLTSGVAVLQTPGLVGNQYQIQLDLSRLPRLEEYVQMMDETTADLQDVPSDLKTVAYYVQSSDSTGGVLDALAELDPDATELMPGGLIRRSLDRAATVEAATMGNVSTLNQTGDLLAPEIKSIEFSYWDGLTWQMEWSSDEFGELPLAVQVRIYMVDPALAATADSDTISLLGPDSMRAFSHIVRLPMAVPLETEEEDLSEAGL
ncbi:prepilin-type cleavage/methylation domain-containing protein [Rubripirellula sp.]|nr:prepilin-type cleavage/methylation domain-containing protein [Rubripirellula sp.]MDB4749353.1 prepilin-type cleavage/methylation domain-containing protein [Rubripirellula sp.]